MEANTRTMAFQNLQFYPGRRLGDGHISGSIQIQAPCKFLRRRLCLLRFCTLPLFSYLFLGGAASTRFFAQLLEIISDCSLGILSALLLLPSITN